MLLRHPRVSPLRGANTATREPHRRAVMDAPRGVLSAADLVSLPALDVMGEYCARQGIERVVWPEVDAWGEPDEWRENGSSSGASFVSLFPGELSSGEPPKDPMRVGFYDRRYHGL